MRRPASNRRIARAAFWIGLLSCGAHAIGSEPPSVAVSGLALEGRSAKADGLAEDESPDLSNLSMTDLVARLPRVGRRWPEGTAPSAPGVAVEESLGARAAVAELRWRLRTGVQMPDELWRLALLSTGAVRARSRWPVGEPFAIGLRSPAWLGVAEVRLLSRTEGFADARGGRLVPSCLSSPRENSYQALGELELGPQSIDFEVEVEFGRHGVHGWSAGPRRPDRYDEDARLPTIADRIAWRGHLTLTVEGVATLDEAIPPMSSRAIDEAVEESIAVIWKEARESGPGPKLARTILVVDPDGRRHRALEALGLSLTVEILDRGELVQAERLRTCGYGDRLVPDFDARTGPASLGLDRVPGRLRYQSKYRPRWTIRVTGSDRDVLRSWDTRRYWSGSVELTLDEAMRHARP